MTAIEREQRAAKARSLRAEMRADGVGYEYVDDDVIADIQSHLSERIIEQADAVLLPRGTA